MTGEGHTPAIDVGRITAFCEALDAFGNTGDGKSERPAFSDAEAEARRWLAGEMDDAGLAVRRDEAGNLFGRFGAEDGAAVMIGGHLDTLPGGGSNGALGLAIAFEGVRAMQDAGIKPAVPIEIVALSDGAGRFGGSVGARAMSGAVTREWIDETRDAAGTGLAEAMAESGIDPWRIFDARLPEGSRKAFLELRSGVGKASPDAPVALAEATAALLHWQVRLTGRGGSCRSVPMVERSDAFAGVAEVAATIPAVLRIVGRPETMATVGSVRLSPDRPLEIASEAEFSLVVEEADERTMKALAAAFRALVERAAKSRGLDATIEEAGQIAPVVFDRELVALIGAEAERLDIACGRQPCAARSDAVIMQSFCPSVLLQLPGSGGEDGTDWDAVAKAARLTVSTLCRLAEAKMPAPDERARESADAEPTDDMDVDLDLDEIMLSDAD